MRVVRGHWLILAGCTALACGNGSTIVDTQVATTIQLSSTAIALDVGASTTVGATVLDQNGVAMAAAVSWSTDDAMVATVTVTATTPTLAAVTITPSSVSLQTGEMRQFSASGELSDGSPTAVTVTYTATGGTISASGLYTAGGTPGTYEVIATEPGSGLADTASVTVTDPAPSGFVELYRLDSFTGVSLANVFNDRSGNDGTQSVVGGWFRQTIPSGANGGWADMFLDGNNGRPDEITSGTVRWSARVRLSSNWAGKGRLLFLAGTPAGDYYAYAGAAGQCPADGNGGNTSRQFFILRSSFAEFEAGNPLRYYDQFVSQTGTTLGNCYGVTGSGGGYGTATYHGGDFLPVGGAEFVVMHELRLNDPGQENGYHRMYIDGVLRAEFDNISFRTAGGGVVLSAVGFKPYISSGGNPAGSSVYVEFTQLLLQHDPGATPASPRQEAPGR
jgi:hypothetical protein